MQRHKNIFSMIPNPLLIPPFERILRIALTVLCSGYFALLLSSLGVASCVYGVWQAAEVTSFHHQHAAAGNVTLINHAALPAAPNASEPNAAVRDVPAHVLMAGADWTFWLGLLGFSAPFLTVGAIMPDGAEEEKKGNANWKPSMRDYGRGALCSWGLGLAALAIPYWLSFFERLTSATLDPRRVPDSTACADDACARRVPLYGEDLGARYAMEAWACQVSRLITTEDQDAQGKFGKVCSAAVSAFSSGPFPLGPIPISARFALGEVAMLGL